jgi:hypothetical protein
VGYRAGTGGCILAVMVIWSIGCVISKEGEDDHVSTLDCAFDSRRRRIVGKALEFLLDVDDMHVLSTFLKTEFAGNGQSKPLIPGHLIDQLKG